MAYVILILGLILIALTFKRTWDFQVFDYNAESQGGIFKKALNNGAAEATGQMDDKDSRNDEVKNITSGTEKMLEDIETKLEVIAEILAELKEGLERIEKGQGAGEKEKESFGEVLAHEKKNALFEDIYAAYDEGKDVTELAREFGRGKGEIELILDLRR